MESSEMKTGSASSDRRLSKAYRRGWEVKEVANFLVHAVIDVGDFRIATAKDAVRRSLILELLRCISLISE